MKSNSRIWAPFQVGNYFYLKPPHLPDSPVHRINITLGNGAAFGSGEHETTRHCLEFLEQLHFTGEERVFDLGTGTGILGIAAMKLGAGSILGLDIDSPAITNAKNNAELNQLSSRVALICGGLDCLKPLHQFDLIIANLYGDILLQHAPTLSNLSKAGGRLLFSGISQDYFFEIKMSFQQYNFQIVKQQIGEEYATLLFLHE